MHLKRFFVDAELHAGMSVKLPRELARRLDVVLRGGMAQVGLFNGVSGLHEAEVTGGVARVGAEVVPFAPCPPLELWLGLPKREAFETSLRMATELGVTRVVPLLTDFVVKKEVNDERARALVIEACEQCERLDVPVIEPVRKLSDALSGLTAPLAWAASRRVGLEDKRVRRLESQREEIHAILVGPEGGFSPAEEQLLLAHPWVVPVSLGSTILRVDTAVAAGLSGIREVEDQG
jgi:16S rRNA (uracil1498-N3)-methyltransferase